MADEYINAPAALTRVEFWQRVAGVAFGLWALMIPIGIGMVRSAVGELIQHDKDQAERLNNYVLAMERRVTLIEERQQRVLMTLSEHQAILNDIRGRNGR
jgi:hypothetical protein